MTTPTATPKSEAPKTRDRSITVDGMKGDNCISKVTGALKSVKDLSVDSVKLGTVKLRAATRDQSTAACEAITKVGFKCREAKPATAGA